MAEHHASVLVHAPVHQVYTLFTHFNDFPKFMHFVKEVTHYDEQRTHWVVQVLRQYEWDAVNEDWIPGQQIGWRSTSGLYNTGKVKFRSLGQNQTRVDVYIHYIPPTGPLGILGDNLGGNSHFASVLQEDLNHFAQMVEQAPPGALDPMSSHYLFHNNSAAMKGTITQRQKAAMANDPRMSPEALAGREARIKQEIEQHHRAEVERESIQQRKAEAERQALIEQKAILEHETAKRLQEKQKRKATLATVKRRDPHPIHDTLGGRNASRDRTAFGDKDARSERHPKHEQGPMLSRHPTTTPMPDERHPSPWRDSLQGPDVCIL